MAGNNRYDLVIIGGGSAAFAAAIKANLFGVKTAMIERNVLGGTCVNVGCVPSKNLLGAGELLHSSKHPTYPSISSCQSDFDFSKAIADKQHLIKDLRKQKYRDVLSGLDNVDLIEASVSFISSKILRIDNGDAGSRSNKIEADKFIIATGSSPSLPSTKGIDSVEYLTNKEALSLKERPSSMIVVGGGPLGLEFAQMYSRFGTKVIVLQRSQRLIPDHEPEISQALTHYLSDEGIEIITGVDIKEVYQKNGIKFITASRNNEKKNNEKTQTQTFEAEQLLMATGRRPNTADLHLENAGVKVKRE